MRRACLLRNVCLPISMHVTCSPIELAFMVIAQLASVSLACVGCALASIRPPSPAQSCRDALPAAAASQQVPAAAWQSVVGTEAACNRQAGSSKQIQSAAVKPVMLGLDIKKPCICNAELCFASVQQRRHTTAAAGVQC